QAGPDDEHDSARADEDVGRTECRAARARRSGHDPPVNQSSLGRSGTRPTTVETMRVGVLASGSGTILRALVERDLPIVVAVFDRPCGAIDVAAAHGVATEVVERTDF